MAVGWLRRRRGEEDPGTPGWNATSLIARLQQEKGPRTEDETVPPESLIFSPSLDEDTGFFSRQTWADDLRYGADAEQPGDEAAQSDVTESEAVEPELAELTQGRPVEPEVTEPGAGEIAVAEIEIAEPEPQFGQLAIRQERSTGVQDYLVAWTGARTEAPAAPEPTVEPQAAAHNAPDLRVEPQAEVHAAPDLWVEEIGPESTLEFEPVTEGEPTVEFEPVTEGEPTLEFEPVAGLDEIDFEESTDQEFLDWVEPDLDYDESAELMDELADDEPERVFEVDSAGESTIRRRFRTSHRLRLPSRPRRPRTGAGRAPARRPSWTGTKSGKRAMAIAAVVLAGTITGSALAWMGGSRGDGALSSDLAGYADQVTSTSSTPAPTTKSPAPAPTTTVAPSTTTTVAPAPTSAEAPPAPTTTTTSKPRKPAPPAPAPSSGAANRVIELVNQERLQAGCSPLRMDQHLTDSAQQHSTDMAVYGYFGHRSRDGQSFVERANAAGYPSPGGENIAQGQRSAEVVMSDWMHSSGHRANILNCSFTAIGVAVDTNGWYWTQDFGY
ncbi:hypothetical protein D5S17_19070 [Pseudonocardiaceae bacterium YIM PH 21723]|nr:hypothetical protein D5S17_19070 [Pseudonocardiaceae bacterium YIM PH 21723]